MGAGTVIHQVGDHQANGAGRDGHERRLQASAGFGASAFRGVAICLSLKALDTP
jgi:hypothetical protein